MVGVDGDQSVEAQVRELRATGAGTVFWRAALRLNASSFRNRGGASAIGRAFRKSATASPGLSDNRPHRSRDGGAEIATIARYAAGETGQ
jgi:hypothetical protein